ncbi:MAG: tetratricopeptide repeat protein [Anaerolineales bacterium]|nr:tetratricopeptide repeat protein [Anaerolineales bacterium]
MARLKIVCLGAFQATLDGIPLTFDTDKTRALLVYLALTAPQAQRRERLAGLFWSEASEERALHNLRQALSTLRKSLQEEANAVPFLSIQRDSIQVNPDSDIWVDAVAFEGGLRLALAHYQHNHSNNHSSPSRLNLRKLQRTMSLFNGPFLDQLYLSGSPLFDEWASLQREALNQQAIQALAILADLHERRGDYAQARQYADQIVALAPWDETAQAQVIRLLAQDGLWSAAQAQYQRLRRYLKVQLGVEPSAETQALFERLRIQAAQNKPLPADQVVTYDNLPRSATPFVGRENELEALGDLLNVPHTRLLTLHGPGGAGKTRLAIQAALEQRGIFREGVFFIPLVSVTKPEMMLRAVAEALGFTFFGNEDPVEQLIRFVEKKHMLWVLDNLEQLLPLSADNLLSQVLRRASAIAMIATSRQRLNLREEVLFPVGGLSYPVQTDIPDQGQHEAVQLFTRLAQRVQPYLNLEAGPNRQSVVGICQLLEGLPLGLELAAASLWAQTPAEVFTNLSSGLHSLASTSVDASQRHQSLRAACEISWELLSREEQSSLARLSVYRGGFEGGMTAGAVAVGAATLASLLEKSLLRRDPSGRYGFHEVVRQFAAEKLAGDAQAFTAARTGHALSFAAFLKVRLAPLKGAGQSLALDEITREWENVRQAWDWLVAGSQACAIADCAEAMFHFCTIRTRYREGIELFARATSTLADSPGVLAKVLTYQGALAFRVQANDMCEAALEQALSIFTEVDAPGDQALCLVYASGLAFRRKKPALARQYGEASLALFAQTGDAWGQSYAWYQMGLLESRAGHVGEAQQAFQTSLQIARSIGDLRRQIGPLNMLGDLACLSGAYAEAETYFTESLDTSRVLDDPFNTGQALINLGTVFQSVEDFDQAKGCYEDSLGILREIGDLGNQALVMANLGELALARGAYSESMAYLQQGLNLASQAGDEWAVLICWINLSEAALGQKDLPTAHRYLGETLPLAAQSAEPALMLRALLQLGRYYLLLGRTERALPLLGMVVQHEATYDEHRLAAGKALRESGLPVPQESTAQLELVMQAELENYQRLATS